MTGNPEPAFESGHNPLQSIQHLSRSQSVLRLIRCHLDDHGFEVFYRELITCNDISTL